MTDKISVIMPALNAGRFIGPALRSLLREPEADLDIIVVDDGSTDDTAAIVSELAASYPCIRLISNAGKGVSRARNTGLAAVSTDSDYITFLDADDHCSPGRIRRQLDIIRSEPGIGMVVGRIQFFESIDEETSQIRHGSRTVIVAGVSLASTLFRRDLFDTHGGFDEALQHGEDVDFFLRILEAQTRYIAEKDVAILYRRHESNMTNDALATRRGFVEAIRRSLARRRASGSTVEIGDLFKQRGAVEESFRNA